MGPLQNAKALYIVMFISGLLLFFTFDKMVGLALVVIGLLVLALSRYLKKHVPLSMKPFSIFFIVGGVVVLALALAVFIFERENLKNVSLEIVLGLFMLVYGFYKYRQLKTQK